MALRDQLSGTGVKVHRDGDILRLEIPSQITFAVNQSAIQPQLYPVLNDVAKVLGEYDKTMLVISGHTDDTGAYDYNMQLSKKRAESVKDYCPRGGCKLQELGGCVAASVAGGGIVAFKGE